MALTEDEIFAGIGELVGDDKANGEDFAKKLRERHRTVAQHLINVGGALKKEELKGKIAELESTVATLTTERDEATEALTAANASKPDVAKLEADLKEKHARKVDELKKQIAAKDETLKGALRKGSIKTLTAELIKAGVDPDYAKEVLAGKHGAAIDVRDDGTVVIKNADGLEYDGADEDAKVSALAADVRKGVAPKWILTNADTGAGVGGSQRTGTGYDARKVGEEMGKQEKAQATNNKLAFT